VNIIINIITIIIINQMIDKIFITWASKRTMVERTVTGVVFALYILLPQFHHIAFGVSFNLIRQSQSNWSLSNGTWQKRRRELDNQLSFEIGDWRNDTPNSICCIISETIDMILIT